MADPTVEAAVPCLRCGKPATCQYSIDPDVTPWRSCEGCKREVQLALMAALGGDEDVMKTLLKKPKAGGGQSGRNA